MSQKYNREQVPGTENTNAEDKSYIDNFGDFIDSQAELVASRYDIDPDTASAEFEWLISSLSRRQNEYLVEGASLTCSMGTFKPQTLIDTQQRPIKSEPKGIRGVKYMSKIQINESRNETINGQIPVNITDTKGGLRDEEEKNGLNIVSFGNCKFVENDMHIDRIAKILQLWYIRAGKRREFSEIVNKIKAAIEQGKGTCYCCMLLNPKWENLPENYSISADPNSPIAELVSLLEYNGYMKFNGKDGINMMSMLFCMNGGVIRAKDSGQLDPEMSFSMQYFDFLLKYETNNGKNDVWLYAKNLADGTITIAGGVVIRDRKGNYPLGEDIFNRYYNKKDPISMEEAKILTLLRLESYADDVRNIAQKKGWVLTQNTFDALIDMAYNLGPGAVRDYKTCDLIATGDLLDEETLKMLRKEILETTAAEIDGQKQWLKNLVERRLDVIRIAQGDVDAYTRNYFQGNWNQDAYQFYLDNGLDEETIKKYPIQKVIGG